VAQAGKGASGDGFWRGHQLARALGIALPLTIFLVWWGMSGGTADVVATREVSAVVIKDEGKTCLVRVESGQEVRILKPRNLREGMRVRMRRISYDNGELRYALIGRQGDSVDAVAIPGAE
jgi:hypothetical protein